MPETEFWLEIDGDPVPSSDARGLAEVQVEEADDTADALTLVSGASPEEGGNWSSLLDPLTSPRAKVVLEIRKGGVAYRFEGRSTEADWDLAAGGASKLTIKALARTLDMDIEQNVRP